MSEFLREQKRDGEVNQQEHGNEQSDCGDEVDLHGLPQFLARLDVEKRQGEESTREQQHDKILHNNPRSSPVREHDIADRACAKVSGFRRGPFIRLVKRISH
jgi:hypothetical protein